MNPPDDEKAARAVVDRVTEGTAVLLVGAEETERHVPADVLPANAGEGSWLLVIDGDPPRVVGMDRDGEAAARRRNRNRMTRLRQQRSSGRFKNR